jgi:predicted GNAT family acetyltransferase
MTKIRVLRPGDEAALEAFLLPRIETSMFLIGNMRTAGLIDRGARYEGTYVAAFEEGRVTGVVAHAWNGNLMLQAPRRLDDLWRAAASASGREIKGLVGPSEQVEAVRKKLDITDLSIQLDETEKLYSLALSDLAVPGELRAGRLRGRRIEPGDLDLLFEWHLAFGLEALGAEDTPELRAQVRASLESLVREGRTWILEDGARPVATSSFNSAVREAVQIGAVWTPPELRSRGYGRAAVAASLLDARAEGVGTAILFTPQDNIPAQRAYEALGFRHIGEYRLLLLR